MRCSAPDTEKQIFLKQLFTFILHVWVSLACMHAWCPLKPEEGIRLYGTGAIMVVSHYEGATNQIWVL